jgi:uncharacterized protein (DUF433 family)
MPILMSGYIEVDDHGVARLAGTRMKVLHLAKEKRAHGWSPEEMKRQHPHLSLAQIHAALAYYYEHQPEIDRQIAQEQRSARGIARHTGPQLTRQDLLEKTRRA